MDGSVSEPSPAAPSVAAFGAIPGGIMLLAAIELSVSMPRLGVDPVAAVLAICYAGALGMPFGGLIGLTVWLGRRRGVRVVWWQRLVGPGLDAIGPALVVGLLVTGAVWWSIAVAERTFEQRPIDWSQAAVQIWRGLAVLAVPPAVVVAVGMLMVVTRVSRRWRRPLARWGVVLWVVVITRHFADGPFVAYFGDFTLWAVALLSVAAIAGVIGPRSVRGLRSATVAAGFATVGLTLGAVGAHHHAARALLLHDSRFFAQVHRGLTWVYDVDGDQDLPTWLGGTDCDDSDPRRAGWRPEIPNNGLDDNCRLGDGAPPTRLPQSAAEVEARPSILLVTIDTVRADHLGLHGYNRETMPNLSALARAGRWYERAYSPSNHTAFSMISMLSGQSPERLIAHPGLADGGGKRFTHWLPDRLAKAGYRTIAINPALVHTGDLTAEQLLFDVVVMGPWDYARKNRGTLAAQLVDSAIEQFETHRGSDPAFVWLHLPDPHATHEAHERFPGADVLDAYDNELAWVDFQLGRALAAAQRRFPQLLIAVTSDHGEAFGERGAWGHGFSLYDNELHVPLILHGPGVDPQIVSDPVSLVGLAPTLLALVGLPIGTVSVPSILEPDPTVPVTASCPFFWSERRMEVALIERRYKLVFNRTANTMALFDRQSDPGERHNVVTEAPEVRRRMEQRLYDALEGLR